MENSLLSLIKEALNKPLPGEKSHFSMLPPGRILNRPDPSLPPPKTSSVLVLLLPGISEIYVCLIKRQPFLKYHGGQIGFPGGKAEDDDFSLIHTALRESEEEIGIRPGDVQILGTLSPLFVSVSGFLIYPFVGWVSGKSDFIIDKNEVEKILLFPLLQHVTDRKIIYADVETQTGILKAPAYEFEGEIIWGATSMILTEFLDIMEIRLLKNGNQILKI